MSLAGILMEHLCKELLRYSYRQILHIPDEYLIGVIIVIIIGIIVSFRWKGLRTGLRYSSGLALVGYVFLIFCSTVFLRKVEKKQKYDFHPFWSYNRSGLLVENIMNVVVFIPVGLLLGFAFKRMTWWKNLLIGCGFSVTIEIFQFCMKRGFSEVDDVMHNTLGCLIGYCVYRVIAKAK